MKLLHHLLASAICVAAVVATSATPTSGHAANVNHMYSSGQDESKFLRGPVSETLPAPKENYDKAEDFPGPDESDDERELEPAADEAFVSEPVTNVGNEVDSLIVPEEDEKELVQDVLAYELATGGPIGDEKEHEEDTEHDFRQLQSVIDPIPVIPETVTGPAFTIDIAKPSGVELMDSKPNLRGPEKEDEA